MRGNTGTRYPTARPTLAQEKASLMERLWFCREHVLTGYSVDDLARFHPRVPRDVIEAELAAAREKRVVV